MGLAASIQITDQDLYQTSSVANAQLIGQMASTSDGRVFAYATSGASTLTAGQITQPVAITANYATRTLTTAVVAGANQVSVPLGTTAAADAFIGFYLVVTDGTGKGQGTFYITGNTAASAGNSNTTLLNIRGAIRVALDTTSVVSIVPNQESAVVQHTAAVAIPTSGVPVLNVAAARWFWNQVQGMSSVLSDGAITKNAGAIPSDAVAGAVEIEVAGTVTQRVGFAPELTVDTKYSPLVLTIVG